MENLDAQQHGLEDLYTTLQNELAELTTADGLPGCDAHSDIVDTGSKALRNFIAMNAVAVVRSNVSGFIFESNRAFCDLLGWTQEEVSAGKIKWTDITPLQYSQQATTAVRALLTEGKAAPFEKEYLHKDGHLVPVMVVIIALDTTGDDWLSFILDMSAQKIAENELQVREAELRHLSESIPQIVWLTDTQSNLIYANQKLYEFSGLSLAELSGNAWQDIIHPHDMERFVDNWKKSTSYSNVYEMEIRYRRKDGRYRWFLNRTAPVVNDQKEVLMWIGTSTDIDDQKHQEEELKESELQYRTLADAIPQIVWTADPDGEIDFFNHRWFEYTGLTWSQSVNNGWTLLIHPEDRDRCLAAWDQALKTGDTYEEEFRLRRAIGIGAASENRYRWHLGRAVSMRNEDGSIQKWFATWTEIEDQKRKK